MSRHAEKRFSGLEAAINQIRTVMTVSNDQHVRDLADSVETYVIFQANKIHDLQSQVQFIQKEISQLRDKIALITDATISKIK